MMAKKQLAALHLSQRKILRKSKAPQCSARFTVKQHAPLAGLVGNPAASDLCPPLHRVANAMQLQSVAAVAPAKA